MTQFTKNHETVLGIARTMIDKRDEVLKNSTTVNYNFLKELNIQRNERLITRLLKSILEFEIPTSEGATTNTTLLSSFIEEVLLVNDEASIAEFRKLDKKRLGIETEHNIPKKVEDNLIYGQIDMVVHYEIHSWDGDMKKKEYLPLIAIEVKIDAGDQEGQCSRYIRYMDMDELKEKRKEFFAFDKLFYISINEKRPSEYAFYDESSDVEMDDRLRVVPIGFITHIINWLCNIREEKTSNILTSNSDDSFNVIFHSFFEVINEWQEGEKLMDQIYNEIKKEEKMVEAIEIAKALFSKLEEVQDDFIVKVTECIKQKLENRLSLFSEIRTDEKISKYSNKSPHKIWKINSSIFSEQLFLYLGTHGNDDTMYIGIMTSDLNGDRGRGGSKNKGGTLFNKINELINRSSTREIIGKYNAKDFIWWCNIPPEKEVEKTLSFNAKNLDILDSEGIVFKDYFEETVNIIYSIFDAFDKEKEDKTPISE